MGENLDLPDIKHEGDGEETGAEPNEDLQSALEARKSGRKASAF